MKHLQTTARFATIRVGAAVLATVFLSTSAWSETEDFNEVIELDPLTVKGSSGYGYNAARSATGTRTPIPISDTPVSIQVVTRQILEDQAAFGLEDVYQNVSGVVEAGQTLNAQSEVNPIIRGFEAPTLLRNGTRVNTVGAVDLAIVETVEVLKGPASILYGALEPGGVVNYTTKRPSSVAFTRIEQSIGSYDNYRTTLDSTGPLNENETLLYRFNAAYTNSGSFRDAIETERVLIAPSVAWRPSSRTDIAFDFAYTKETLPYDSGIPIDANGQPLVEADTFFGDPDLEGRTLEDWFAGYHLNHRINENLTFRNRFQYHDAKPLNQSIRNRGVRGEPGAETLRQRFQDEERDENDIQFVADILAEFEIGESKHTAIIGFDYIDQQSEFNRFRTNLPAIAISDNPNVDITPLPDFERSLTDKGNVEWLALYAQDQISLLSEDRLKILIGGRLDMAETNNDLFSISKENDEFTGRFGILYEANEAVSPYFSVTQSFLPNDISFLDRDRNFLDPETGLQYEVGLKIELYEHNLLATVSAFEIQKEDVAVFDNIYFQQTGEFAFLPGVDQQSRGLEIDLSGQITENLSVIANYAYTDAEVTANLIDPSNVGSTLGNVPEHTLRLWTAYNFRADSPLDGLGFGFGGRFEDSRLVQFGDIELDSYTTFDAAIWYNYEGEGGRKYTARLNIKNLLDEDYIVRASDQSIAHPGAPLSATASFGVGF